MLLLAVPIPYKLTAIASGLFKLKFPLFFVASIFIRGLRFFLVAGLTAALRRADAGVHRKAPGPGGQRRRPGLIVAVVLVLRFAALSSGAL